MNTFDFSETSLTEEQRRIADEIVRSGREPREIIAEHGIDDDTFTEWVTGGIFPSYTSYLARCFAGADEPFVWAKLVEQICKGNVQAIKLYFSLNDKKSAHPDTAHFEPIPAISELRSDIFGEEEYEE